MSMSTFRMPGDEIPYLPGSSADALLVRTRGLGARAPRPKAPAAKDEDAGGFESSPPIPEETATGTRGAVRLSDVALGHGHMILQEEVIGSVQVKFESVEGTRQVILELWAALPDEDFQRINTRPAKVDSAGKAAAKFFLDPPKGTDAEGKLVTRCAFQLKATHPDTHSAESPILEVEAAASKPFEGVVYYSPLQDTYLILETEEDIDAFFTEVKQVEGLRTQAQKAWEAPDPSKRMEALEEVEKAADKIFGGKTTGDAKRGMEELLLLQDNRKKGELKGWVFGPEDGKDGRFKLRKFKKSEAATAKNKLMKNGGTGKRWQPFEGKLKANLWKPGSKSWPDSEVRTFRDKGEGEGDYFIWTREAVLGRFICGWDGGQAGYDPEKKTFKFGASGQASASLFEGKVTGALDIPDRKGANILSCLKGVKYGETYLVDPSRSCLLILRISGELTGFVGVQAHAALAFPSLNFKDASQGKQSAEIGGSVGGLAGAQGKGSTSLGILWSSMANTPFKDLGKVGVEVGGTAGIAGELNFKVEYKNGRFIFQFGASLAWMLGVKGGFIWDVDARQGWEFLGHMLDCVDFHIVKEILKDAYEAYAAYSSVIYLADQQRAQAILEWSKAGGNLAGRTFKALRSHLLRNEADFLAVKASYKQLSGMRSTMAKMSPETLGLALAAIMKTREDSDFEAILFILGSTTWRKDATGAKGAQVSPDHKLKWVLRYITDTPDFEGPDREKKKEDALKAGLRKLKEFGHGFGYGDSAERSSSFLEKLDKFLKVNGLSLP